MINKMICRLAHQWAKKMPPTSMYGAEDLIQEGHIVRIENEKELDRKKSKETTYLWMAIVWHFNCIKRMEWRRLNVSYDFHQDDEDCGDKIGVFVRCSMVDNCPNADRQLRLSQALSDMSEVAPEFVSMIIDGVPPDLYFMARNHQRTKRFRNGWPAVNGCFRINNTMLRDFFNVDLKKMETLFYNNV